MPSLNFKILILGTQRNCRRILYRSQAPLVAKSDGLQNYFHIKYFISINCKTSTILEGPNNTNAPLLFKNFLIVAWRNLARQRVLLFINISGLYHRILKYHVLLDLKIGEFDHSDAGQMNVNLNYYKDKESVKGDNDPIDIILCSGKNEALVKYATMGLPQQVFVSKYLINLPTKRSCKGLLKTKEKKV